jgi:DNA-binding protein YbaB
MTNNPNAPSALNAQMLDFLKGKGEEMVKHFQEMQDALRKKRIVGLGGVKDSDKIFVEVVFNGLQEPVEITIGDGAWEEGMPVVNELLLAALKAAMEKLKGIMQQEVMGVYEKSGLPLAGEDDE